MKWPCLGPRHRSAGGSFWYTTVLGQKYQVPVWSVIVLLRPAADGPELTGVFEKSRGSGT